MQIFDIRDNKAQVFSWAFLFSILYSLSFFLNKYPPMTDLPQHATQVYFFLNRHNTQIQYDKLLYVNWITPYSLGLLISCSLAKIFPILFSLKITLVISLVATFYMSLKLIEELGGDLYWSLLSFPLFFGYSFYWGFFPFLTAYPFAILYFLTGIKYFKHSTVQRAFIFFLSSLLIFFGHMLLFLFSFAVLCGFYLRFFKREQLLNHINRLCVFALPALFFSLIFFLNKSKDPSSIGEIEWRVNPILKLLEILIFSNNNFLDHLTLFLSILTIITVSLGSEKNEKNLRKFIPFLVACILFIITPNTYFGVYYLYQRFASLTIMIFLFSLTETKNIFQKKISQTLIIFIVMISGFYVHYQSIQFDTEAREIDPIVEKIPLNQKIAQIVYDSESNIGDIELRHFPCWYIVEKGGDIRFSFATLAYSLVRYKKQLTYPQLYRLTFTNNNPLYLNPEELIGFSYLVIRSRANKLTTPLLKDFDFIEKSGSWFLLKNKKKSTTNS